MHVAAHRPHFTAGVALLGAGVIAASAVTPTPDIHLPEIQLPSVHVADVDLAALANPLEVYAKVFQDALANANTLAANTVPGQVLNQLLANQVSSGAALLNGLSTTGGEIAAAASQVPAALATAVNLLAAGNVSGAVNALLGVPLAVAAPGLDLLPVLQTVLTKPLENLVNVINAFTRDPLATLLAVSGFVAPLISTAGAIGTAIQDVIDAVGTGGLGAVANAVVAAPGTIADGVLNGGYGPDLGSLAGIPPGSGISVLAGGLLSSGGGSFDPVSGNFVINTGGPLYALQQVLKIITDAIAPSAAAPVVATAAIASLPAADAATVTLTTAATPAKTQAATDTAKDATDAVASSSPATKDPAVKDEPAKAAESSPVKEATSSGLGVKTGTDVKTGNKVEPKTPTGSDGPKPGGSTMPKTDEVGAANDQPNSTSTSATGTDKGGSIDTPTNEEPNVQLVNVQKSGVPGRATSWATSRTSSSSGATTSGRATSVATATV